MHTQCPQCDTRFRLTETQLKLADGNVRCSVCQQIFNALEIAAQSQSSGQQPLLDQPLQQQPLPQPPLINQQNTNDDTLNFSASSTDATDSTEELYVAADNTASIDCPPDIGEVDFDQNSVSDDSHKDAFDFFDDVANEPQSHVVPEKYKDSYTSNTGSLLSNLSWSVGILILCVSLLFQYAWFNRDQLNQLPQLQAWTEKLCQHVTCKDIRIRDPQKIELVSRNVYSHPKQDNALMIDITMKNLAEFAQPLPVMQINFSDVRGGQIAARRFLPQEYLATENWHADSSQQLFEPGTTISFTMEIQDPGKQALTYVFDFL